MNFKATVALLLLSAPVFTLAATKVSEVPPCEPVYLERLLVENLLGRENALCAHVDRKDNVREVCAGTEQVDDIEFYLNRPRIRGDFHGQTPMLWLIGKMPVNP